MVMRAARMATPIAMLSSQLDWLTGMRVEVGQFAIRPEAAVSQVDAGQQLFHCGRSRLEAFGMGRDHMDRGPERAPALDGDHYEPPVVTTALLLLAVGAVVGAAVGAAVALAVGAAVAALVALAAALAVLELDEPVVARLVPLDELLACPG